MERGEEGATATLVVLGIAALLGAALVAVDAGSVLHTRRGLIADTDAAALGTAIELLDDRCATASDATAEAALIAQTNDPETVVTDVVVDRGGDCTAGFGTVAVATENPAELFFAPFFGVDEWRPDAVSTAVYGRIQALEGLRPIGLCGLDVHYQQWQLLQTTLRTPPTLDDEPAQLGYDSLPGTGSEYPVVAGAGVVHRVPFQRTDIVGPCGAAGGNWGWLDLGGGSNSNSLLRRNIREGYPGIVDLGGPGLGDEDCIDTQSDDQDCEGDPGGGGNSTGGDLDAITCFPPTPTADCDVIYIIVYDTLTVDVGNGGGNNGGGNSGGGNSGGGNSGGGNSGGGNNGGGNNGGGGGGGANAEFHPVGFLGLILRGHEAGTGQAYSSESSYLDLEFVDELTEGHIGPALPNDPFPGPRGVQMCASEHFDGCPDP